MTKVVDAGAPDTPITLDSGLREIRLFCANQDAFTYPAEAGQEWDFAVMFKTIEHLAEQLSAGVAIPKVACKGTGGLPCNPPFIRKGELVKIALVGHGDSGGVLRLNVEKKEDLASQR